MGLGDELRREYQRTKVLTRMAEERRKPGRGRGKPVVVPGDDDESDVSSDFSSGSSTGSPTLEDSGSPVKLSSPEDGPGGGGEGRAVPSAGRGRGARGRGLGMVAQLSSSESSLSLSPERGETSQLAEDLERTTMEEAASALFPPADL